MDGGNGAQMDEEEEDEEDGSPDGGNGGQGMTTDDYEEIDYKICGELGKLPSSFYHAVEEKNRALDEFAQTQNPEGAIQVRIQ